MPVISPTPRRRSEPTTIWNAIARWAVLVGVFAVPFMVSASVTDTWEMPKLVVLLLAVTIGWLAFFLDALQKKSFRWTWLRQDWLIVILGGVVAISTAWSVRPWQSVAGIGGWTAETLPFIIGGIGLTMLVRQLFFSAESRRMLWWAALAGIGIAILFQLWQFLGVKSVFHALPADKMFSYLANSTGATAVLAAVFATLMLGQWSGETVASRRWLWLVGVVASWVVLLVMSRPIGWGVFTLGMLWFVWRESQLRGKANSTMIIVVVLLAAVGIVAQLANVAGKMKFPSSAEATLDVKTSMSIMGQTLKHRPILGSGPETWYQDFVGYRSNSFNATQAWNTRFIKADSAWIQELAMLGVVGTTAWLAVLVWPLWLGWKRRTLMTAGGWELSFLIATVFIAGLWSTWSLPLLLLVFLALGLEPRSDKPASRPMNIGLVMAFAGFLVVAGAFWFGATNVVMAAVRVHIAQDQITATKPLDSIQAMLTKATQNDSHNEDAAVLLANAVATKAELAIQAQNTTNVNTILQQALSILHTAVARDPKNPAMIEAENNLLNRLASYVSGAEVQAQQNFKTLAALEPSNPVHDVGYGQTLMLERTSILGQTTVTDTQKQQAAELLTKALAAFDSALKKKPDYIQASYSKAQALAAGGQNDQALTEFNALVGAYPGIAPLWTGRGVVLAALKRTADANSSFDQALKADPKDTSAYLAYAQSEVAAGNKTHAKDILNQGLKAVPGDQSLTSELASIK